MLRGVCNLFLTLVLLAGTVSAQQELPESLKTALSEGGPVTLYSISPRPDSEGQQFLGYPVLGEASIESTQLTKAVLEGLEKADPKSRLDCFVPRHGLNFQGHKLLICYACHSVVAEFANGQKQRYAITDQGHEELARAVYEQGLPWQGWQPVGDSIRHQSGLSVQVPDGFEGRGTAGTEILYLESRQETVQQDPLPGALVLVSEEGKEELATTWLDHSDSGKWVWYLTGLPASFDPTTNQLTCRGLPHELAQLKARLPALDQPARKRARIQLRPLGNDTILKRELIRFRRAGYQMERHAIEGTPLMVGYCRKDGVKMEAVAGLVATDHGPVLLTSEAPLTALSTVAGLLRSLRS